MPRSIYKKIRRNFLILLSGRAVSALLQLVSTVIAARILSPKDLGYIAILYAYIFLIRGLLSVKPFEAMVRYGSKHFDTDSKELLGNLAWNCFKLDILSSILGLIISMMGINVLCAYGLLSYEYMIEGYFFCLILLFCNDGTAVGALRIWNKFNTISYCLIAGALVKLVGLSILYSTNLTSFQAVAAVWTGSAIIQYVLLQFNGWKHLRKLNTHKKVFKGNFSSCSAQNPGIWRFLHIVYWQSSLDLLPKRGSIILSGFFLGAETAALFRIASDLSGFLSKPALLIRQVIFPDLSRLSDSKKVNESLKIASKTSVATITPALILTGITVILGEEIIRATAGDFYTQASTLLTILIFSATFELAASPYRPLLYSIDKAYLALTSQVIGSVFYAITFLTTYKTLIQLTPGIANFVLQISTLIVTLFFILKWKKKLSENC